MGGREVTQCRLITAFAVTLIAAGCAHLPSDSAPEAGTTTVDTADHSDAPSRSLTDKLAEAFAAESAATGLSVASEPTPASATPEPPRDLWDRIRAGMRMEVRNDPRVEAELAFYAKRPEYMERVAERAEPYLHYIVEELERRGMPTELALLPVVESAFQPLAYSPGHAAGIWQFIPSTGRHYGLKQTWWYDGRRDIVASTKAALDYLQRLYGYFSDWELALAAYNSGEGTVMRAIRANQKRGLPTDYWSLRLPRETQAYVPRLLAIRSLVAEPERYQITLRSIPDEPYLTVVDVGSQIDLALAAKLAELPVDELYRLNPGFNRWATDPNGPHLLVLPIEKAENFEQALAGLPRSSRVRWERHKISRGETLSEIANRYHTTVEVLKQVNEMRSTMIRAGQHLLVPVSAKSAPHYVVSAGKSGSEPAASASSSRSKRIHTVKSGDTLWEIGRRYGASTQQIAAWNRMSPKDTIRPGQNLVVWTQTPAAGTNADETMLAKTAATVANANASIPPQKVRYKVRRGDSLYAIARKFNVSIDDLLRWNDLSKKNYLRPGQLLMVHVDAAAGSI
jgi:membrane-bound lytic murein transglycosylase D